MQYLSIKETAEKWGVSVRRVQILCSQGMIEGSVKKGHAWLIPNNAEKPVDRRIKTEKIKKSEEEKNTHLILPRKNPLIIFSDLYQKPGTEEEVISAISDNSEASRLMRLQFEYQHGDIEKMYEESHYFLKNHSGYNAVIGAGTQLAMCALLRGDLTLWRKARQHVYEAPCSDENERLALQFWISSIDSAIYDTSEFPEWFTHGKFDVFNPDVHGTARMFYVKYLFLSAHMLAKGDIELKDVSGFGLMRTLPYIIEPMICQAKIEKTLMPEIYLRLMAATVYHNLGENEKSIPHIDKAIELCLPDRIFMALSEYVMQLDGLLEERMMLSDKSSLKKVLELHKKRMSGWVKLHNILLERNVSETLTVREREVAKLAAFGLTNIQIAERLHIEVTSVKSYIFSAMNKVGANKRTELGLYI